MSERSGDHKIDELLDRMRRVETRLTSWLEAQGFATHARKPSWHENGTVVVGSLQTPLEQVLAAIPDAWGYSVVVKHKGRVLMTIVTPRRGDDHGTP